MKWFNGQKGYGFIQPDAGGKDVFVHISAVEKAGYDGLAEGAKVSFDVVPNKRQGVGREFEDRLSAPAKAVFSVSRPTPVNSSQQLSGKITNPRLLSLWISCAYAANNFDCAAQWSKQNSADARDMIA